MRLSGLILISLIGAASASPVTEAVFHRDVVVLESETATTPDEIALGRGAALALRHRDAAALAVLEPLRRTQSAREVQAAACYALSDVYLRQTRYREAHDALACVADQGQPLTGEPLQVLRDTAALAGEAAMTITPASGTLMARRDRAGLIRVPIAINDTHTRAVIDSDASFSVISKAMARHFGLRLLPDTLTIVTTARPDQPMQLAIADRLQFGDAVLTHVVFAVLPDAAVRFGQDYQMETVIGLPVLVALGRIAYDSEAGTLQYGRSGSASTRAPNLALSGLDPFILVDAGQARLRLALDTAADKTSLNAAAFAIVPKPADGDHPVSWQGAGGRAEDAHASLLPSWRIRIGDTAVTLSRIPVLSQREDDRHGALGLDALNSVKGWVLDFDAMCFWLEK